MNKWDFGDGFEMQMGKRFYLDVRIPFRIPRANNKCPLKMASA